jgi:predicted RNA-binding Zn ribbon-like protein
MPSFWARRPANHAGACNADRYDTYVEGMALTHAKAAGSGEDPRPLRFEPLPLDLLNTTWIEGGRVCDLLETVAGTAIWLDSAVLEAQWKPDRVDEAHRQYLCAARGVLRALAEHPDDPVARQHFNGLLRHGHRGLYLRADGPTTQVVVDDRHWLVPWLAGEAYFDLLNRVPDRIQQCQHPQCVLWYLDTSPSGTRRWCSMTICGNRVKARRYYKRKPN